MKKRNWARLPLLVGSVGLLILQTGCMGSGGSAGGGGSAATTASAAQITGPFSGNAFPAATGVTGQSGVSGATGASGVSGATAPTQPPAPALMGQMLNGPALPDNQARTRHTATKLDATFGSSYDGTVVIIGGEGGDSSSFVLQSAYIFTSNSSTGSLKRTTGDMVTGRSLHTATLITTGPHKGKILIAGGRTDQGHMGTVSAISTLELYDPTTQLFTAMGAMSIPRAGHQAVVMKNGHIFFVGGHDQNGNPVNYSEILDVNSWQIYGGASLARDGNGQLYPIQRDLLGNDRSDLGASYFSALLLPDDAGRILVVYSNKALTQTPNGTAGPMGYQTIGQIYDPTTGAFSMKFFVTDDQWFKNSVVLLSNNSSVDLSNRVFMTGGVNLNNYSEEPHIYSFEERTIYAAIPNTSLIQPRFGHQSLELKNGNVLVIGGFGGSASCNTNSTPYASGPYRCDNNVLASTEVFDIVARKFKQGAPMARPRYDYTSTLLNNGNVLLVGGTTRPSFITGTTFKADYLPVIEVYKP